MTESVDNWRSFRYARRPLEDGSIGRRGTCSDTGCRLAGLAEPNQQNERVAGGDRVSDMPPVMLVAEAARVLRVSEPTIYRSIKSGALRGIRLGRRVVVPRAAIEELLAGPAKKARRP